MKKAAAEIAASNGRCGSLPPHTLAGVGGGISMPRDQYIRAHVAFGRDGKKWVRPFANQDSSLVTVMASANSLIRRPPHAPAVANGETVRILGPTG